MLEVTKNFALLPSKFWSVLTQKNAKQHDADNKFPLKKN